MSDAAPVAAPAVPGAAAGTRTAAQWLAEARAKSAAGDAAGAADAAAAAAAADPGDPAVHMTAGGAAFAAGRHEQAVALFERVVRLTPAHGRALVNVGAVHNRTGNYREAEKALLRGIALETGCVEGFYNLGIARRKLGKNRPALDAYKEAVRLDPSFAPAHANLGNVLVDLGRFKAAADAYRAALRADPTFDRAAAGLRNAEQRATEKNPAFSAFGRLVEQPDAKRKKGAAREREYPKLSAARRERDRRELHALAHSVQETTAESAAALKTGLLAELTRLEHVILGSTGGRLTDASEGLAEALETFEKKSRPAARFLLKLRAHEELIRAPVLPDRSKPPKAERPAGEPAGPAGPSALDPDPADADPSVPEETGSSLHVVLATGD